MGWWGFGLLDGDSPADIYHNVAVDYLGGHSLHDDLEDLDLINPKLTCNFYVFSKKPTQKDIRLAWDKIVHLDKNTYDPYYYIILSLIAMRFGIIITRDQKKVLRYAINELLNEASEFKSSKERANHLNLYLEMIEEKYNPPTKYDLQPDGTFEIVEHNSVRFINSL